MTCMPASRRARATTLTPRSWPSSPTLARMTRMGGSFPSLLILSPLCGSVISPEDVRQRRHDLADRAAGAGRLDEGRHQVLARRRDLADLVEHPPDGIAVALRLELA